MNIKRRLEKLEKGNADEIRLEGLIEWCDGDNPQLTERMKNAKLPQKFSGFA